MMYSLCCCISGNFQACKSKWIDTRGVGTFYWAFSVYFNHVKGAKLARLGDHIMQAPKASHARSWPQPPSAPSPKERRPYGRFARAAPAVWRFAQAAPHRTALCPGGPPPYGALPKRPPAVRRFAQAAPHRTGALPRRPPPCGATFISRQQEPPGTRALTRKARAWHSGSGPGPGRCSDTPSHGPPPHGS